jgi:hypothetical protein
MANGNQQNQQNQQPDYNQILKILAQSGAVTQYTPQGGPQNNAVSQGASDTFNRAAGQFNTGIGGLNVNQLGQLINAYTGGAQQGGQSGQQAANPTSASLLSGSGATNLAAGLGAAALGQPMIVNQQPNQGTMTQGGIYGPGQTTVSSDVPIVPGQGGGTTWNQLASANNLTSADIAELQKTGKSPDQLTQGTQFGLNLKAPQATQALAGPWSTQPTGSVFVKAATPTATTGGTPTPTTPAFAASGTSQPTPWASAPPAPGAFGGGGQDFMAAHNGALEAAGKAFYTHLTGNDPSTATPQDIADVHTTLANHVAQQYTAGANPSAASLLGTTPSGAPPPNPMAATGLPGNLPGIAGGPPAFGSAPVTPPPITLPSATGVKKAHSGGLVPGRGHTDSVPALLTPGEYVLNRQQTAQLFGGRAPIRMNSGGVVPDDDQDQPPEVRRKPLVTGGSGATSASQSSSAPATPASQSSSSSAPAAPGAPSQGSLFEMLRARAQIGGGGLPQYNQPLPAGATDYIANGPNGVALGPEGQTLATPTPGGGWQGTGMTGPGTGGEMGNLGAAKAATAIGGIGSALAQAAKTYANSVGSWKMQPSSPMMYAGANRPAEPAAQFSQQPSPEGKRQGSQANSLADYYKNYFPFMT